ncbi:MAG: NFACT family protein, partial [Clostridiales bacterium]|nr:NFACT family protein [Clostridiales bacterium]
HALIGGRIDKITQPERDEIHLLVRNNGENLRLIASASSSNPRIHLTACRKESPEKAPMFCMLLRKHIAGGKILGFSQPDFERVIKMNIACYDELGDSSVKTLVTEIMGRHSNIILTDGEAKILGSVKHVDFTVSGVRQVLPGMRYELPPSQDKLNPLNISASKIYPVISASTLPADEFILKTFTGVGPLNARELAYRAFGDAGADLAAAGKDGKANFADVIADFFRGIKRGAFRPVLLFKDETRVWDFNAVAVGQYGNAVRTEENPSLCAALDAFYQTRDHFERMAQKSAGLLKFIDNNLARCQKKLALQQQKLKDSEKREQYKIYGDLLVGNLHRMSDGMAVAEVENYYDNMNLVKIPLVREFSPSKNAQRYYTLYQKAKNAEKMSKEQIALTTEEIEYLESVKDSAQRAENEKDLREIRDELTAQGYHAKRTAGKGGKEKTGGKSASEPHRFVIDGYEVFVGKNNTQNDRLTLKDARSADLWFHVKNFPGSHTVVKTNGETPPDDTIVKAAKLAAYFSKAKDSANVPVDYTAIKNVKKPGGAKPGMVIYVNYSTVNVTPQMP